MEKGDETKIRETNAETASTDREIPSLGLRLKMAREALGLDLTEAGKRLRLNKKYLEMMEKENYPQDLPPSYIKGYLCAYGKLLQIPEREMKAALNGMQAMLNQRPYFSETKVYPPLEIKEYRYFPIFTSLILLTTIGLTGLWLYWDGFKSHTKNIEIVKLKIPIEIKTEVPKKEVPILSINQTNDETILLNKKMISKKQKNLSQNKHNKQLAEREGSHKHKQNDEVFLF